MAADKNTDELENLATSVKSLEAEMEKESSKEFKDEVHRVERDGVVKTTVGGELDPLDLAFLSKTERKKKHDFKPGPKQMPPPAPKRPKQLLSSNITGFIGIMLGTMQIMMMRSLPASEEGELEMVPYMVRVIISFAITCHLVTGLWAWGFELDGFITYPWITFLLVGLSLIGPAFWYARELNETLLLTPGVDYQMIWFFRWILWGPLVYVLTCSVFASLNHYHEKEKKNERLEKKHAYEAALNAKASNKKNEDEDKDKDSDEKQESKKDK